MDLKFYEKFPCCFKTALKRGEVSFTEEPQIIYETFEAYRGIFREKGGNFSSITFDDFLSYAERVKLIIQDLVQKIVFILVLYIRI